jgi:Xaa-Pro aminopeptidase
VTDLLIVGDTERCMELRHELPLRIGDPFLYAEIGERRVAVVWSIEGDRIAAVDPSVEIVPSETISVDDLVAAGVDYYEIVPAQMVRSVRALGITRARVPFAFPLRIGDALRADGVELVADQRLFDERRRRKTSPELEGIRRASQAAVAGQAAIAALLARSEPGDGGRMVDGERLTSELLRAAADEAFAAHGCRSDDAIAAHGAQAADGHHQGEGQLANDDVVVCDLFPLDLESGCYSDMTRTYSVGTPDPELVAWHAHTREALEHVRSLVEPGAHGAGLYRSVCRFFEDLGYPTRLSAEEGTVLREGFNHGLGHGVGLEVHEAPGLSRTGHELVAGDVITLEPGLYRRGFGGVRLEDLVVVTEEGCETLTTFPYDLDPARSVVETAR